MTVRCLTRRPISGDPCRGMWRHCLVHKVYISGEWYNYPVQVPVFRAVRWGEDPLVVDRDVPIVVVHCGPAAPFPGPPELIRYPRQVTQRWPTLKMSDPVYMQYVKHMTEYLHDVYAYLYEVVDRPDGYSIVIWKVWDK